MQKTVNRRQKVDRRQKSDSGQKALRHTAVRETEESRRQKQNHHKFPKNKRKQTLKEIPITATSRDSQPYHFYITKAICR